MNKKTKKRLIVAVAAILVCAIAFVIVWSATSDMRWRNRIISDVKTSISEYRNGESQSIYFWIYDDFLDDAELEEFILTQAQEMCENDERILLGKYLEQLEKADYDTSSVTKVIDDYFLAEAEEAYQSGNASALASIIWVADDLTSAAAFSQIMDVVNEYCVSVDNIEEALELHSSFAKRYDQFVPLNRNSSAIATYIEKNGTNPVTKTPGEGYYADKEDKYHKTTIGIEGSPLYNSTRHTYMGDFKYVKKSGVELNKSYKETSYSKYSYYFRDQMIYFSPDEGECVWSGKYLFCFASDGKLIGYATIE